jgi:hypothetical protein
MGAQPPQAANPAAFLFFPCPALGLVAATDLASQPNEGTAGRIATDEKLGSAGDKRSPALAAADSNDLLTAVSVS